MSLRYLYGPVDGPASARLKAELPEPGDCVTFGPGADVAVGPADSWEGVLARLPAGWRPDLVALWLPYGAAPAWAWAAPVPVVAVAPDWNATWHAYRHLLPCCDATLTDLPGVAALRRAGVADVRPVNLFGPGHEWFADEGPAGERDVDVLFVGNLHPAVQRERLRWLGRLAGLADRWRVEVRTGVFGADYRRLMRRARVVFNRSIRGECNLRALEAAAAGALLFQEAGNAEVPLYLEEGRDYVAYSADDLEAKLEHYLADEPARRAIAERAREKARGLTFATLWGRALADLEHDIDRLREHAGARAAAPAGPSLLGRAWARLGGHDLGADPQLAADLRAGYEAGRSAEVALALGALAPSPAESAEWFARALDAEPRHPVAAANLAEALAALGRGREAADRARQALALLDRQGGLGFATVDAPPYPPGFQLLRVEWERAGAFAEGLTDEAAAKAALLRWRLHALLADLSGELAHYHEAALARPDLPPARAALGCALARSERGTEALPHLRAAVAADPFDRRAARALFQALADAGARPEAARLAASRRLLSKAAPETVPAEDWFTRATPSGDELASLVVLCCNELAYTRLCLESVLRHTRAPYELIVVDNGSTDGTPDYLASLAGRPGPARVEVIRNAENRGYAAGVNQGLAAARGDYLVLLNNDVVLTPRWLEGLVAWSLHDHPAVGLVGAVSNSTRPPQLVQAGYADLAGLNAFARHRAEAFAGRAAEAERLTGFCLLVRREVLAKVGALDEGYGLGFFEDDDLCVRALAARYRLLAAQDVYVHHFGSRTFESLGLDTERQLRENFERFRGKWGEAHAAGYGFRGQPATSLPPLPAEPAANGAAAPAAPRPAPAASGRMRVSLFMMVRDEEHNLPDCLAGVRGLVDEVVVVDTGSKDRTCEVAASLGARVFDFPWCDSFAAARNEGLRHATGDYAFWLDADDRVGPEDREKLRALFASLKDENAAYAMKCVCVPDRPGASATVVDHVRLFRNRPEHRWRYRVHEQILPALRASGADVRFADVAVRHVGYTDPAVRARKLQRDLRLLELERAENPNDAFTLFNLGSVYQELKREREALVFLRESLARSHPRDSITRKLYALIASCHRQLSDPAAALKVCREGREHYPDDAELLFLEALALREQGDRHGAESALKRLIEGREGPHFASVDAALRGYKARHNLAVIYMELCRKHEAEAQWRACLVEEPSFLPARLGLGELYVRHKDWAALEGVAAELEALGPEGAAEAEALRGRARMERGELASARWLLNRASEAFPTHLGLKVLHSHAALREGADPAAAERALRAVLELDPGNPEARHNLDLLLAGAPAPVTLDSLYKEACKRPSDINEHLPTLRELASGCRHVTEFGTRTGVSTTAFLHAQPGALVCYDLQRLPPVDRLERLAGGTRFEFRQEDVLAADIAETELLFIDTWHVYGQLKAELERHAARARRWIVLHDTEAFRERGESEGHQGLWPAVEEFLARGEFRLKQHYANNNGLTVLERVTADEPVTAASG